MTYGVRAATKDDYLELYTYLRQDDVYEFAIFGNPYDVLMAGYKKSIFSSVFTYMDAPLFLWGVVDTLEEIGEYTIWACATESLQSHSREFLRTMRSAIEESIIPYPKVSNVVWAENESHIKWLNYIGFTIFTDEPITYNDNIFYYFSKEQ